MTRIKYRKRTIRVAPDSTILHLVAHCGVMPADPPKGFLLYKVTAINDRMTFHYKSR